MNKNILTLLLTFLLFAGCNAQNDNITDQGMNPNEQNEIVYEQNSIGNFGAQVRNHFDDQGRNFPDVVDHWAQSEIAYISNRDIIQGYLNGRFGPDDQIRRNHAALMLQRELNFDTANRPNPNFIDISVDHPEYEVIATLADEGIFRGNNGRFNPNAPITRAETAAILQRAFNLEGTGDFEFRDVSTDYWGHQVIQSLLAHQITRGYGDRSFRPTSNISRAEFSVFMARVLNDDFKIPLEDPQEEEIIDDEEKDREELTVHFLDVGQGDSSVIHLPNGKVILVDAGTQTAGQKVVAYLKQAGISSIDLVVATHAHADHIGGLLPIFEEFDVKQVLDSGRTHTTQTYMNYLTSIDEKDIPFEIAEVGSEIDLDPNVKITVLNTGSEQKSLNDSSVSLKITYDQVNFLFTGDAEELSEGEMAAAFDLTSQILHAGHHGSRTSSTQLFLDNVQPEVAILSFGQGNRYNHPHNEVIERLRANGATLYATAANGDIIVTSDGLTYEVKNTPWDGTGHEGGSTGDEDDYIFPININTANEEELQQITGVGPVIATRIIEYRETHGDFTSIEQIQNVSGIGPATFEGMKDEITI